MIDKTFDVGKDDYGTKPYVYGTLLHLMFTLAK